MVNFNFADNGSIHNQLLNTDIVISSGASIANIETVQAKSMVFNKNVSFA